MFATTIEVREQVADYPEKGPRKRRVAAAE
jgi:hypothetical protein